MIWQDILNGSFELFGGVFILLHCLKLIHDKKVKCVSIIAISYFAAWGFWNIYYYPFLNQWCSLIGGSGIVAMNCLYVYLLIHYTLKNRRSIK